MQNLFLVLVCFFILGCQINNSDKTTLQTNKQSSIDSGQAFFAKDSIIYKALNEDKEEVLLNEEVATFFIVVADTGLNYYLLNQKMYALSDQLHMQIDTMGRYYNKNKDLISLPVNHEDKVYAGAYFPRRFPSASLSLEYLSFYREQPSKNTIALVAGIYEKQESADSALSVLRKAEENPFMFKTNIYIGCVH
jgi:hypothetical protein